MSADLKTAASAVPKTLVSQSLATSDTVLYTAAAGTSVKLSKIRVTNADGSARNVTLTIVKAGGASGATNKIMSAESVAAGARVDLGSGDWLGEGDFISGFAPSSTNVDIVISGIEFGGGTGSALTGIQDDAIGTIGRTSATGTVTNANDIGTGSNRYLLAMLCVVPSGTSSYTTYTTLTMTAGAVAMTRLGSADLTSGANLQGSVHLFGLANPASGTTPTLTASVVKAGLTFDLGLASISLSGVASVTGVTTTSPSSSAVLNLSLTSASGHRPFWAIGLDDTPAGLNFNRRIRAYNNISSSAFTRPRYMIFADALGAATIAATTAVAAAHCGVGIDLVPA